MTAPAPDYVAELLQQALHVADHQADQAARMLTRAREETERAEAALADANARRAALTTELRQRQATHPDNVALRAHQAALEASR